ncbi:MAG TPA: LLM class F420-dependent oxidoreductase [Anaerolineae bacterium]|nr:LLM class F420-dependent oxidoreductase [Anaerolineae bacterium]
MINLVVIVIVEMAVPDTTKMERCSMQIGVVFPQTEFGHDPLAVRDFTQTAEALGYTHILAYDHILGVNRQRAGGWQGIYDHEDSFLEPFVLFAYMAGVAATIEFVTGIIILPQRETAVVAKQAATLDRLANGRFRLGIGVGWNHMEYEALNQDFGTRGRRVEEQIDLLKKLWCHELIQYKGEWHQIDDMGLNPLPQQQPIPIWLGGHADAVLRRVAKMGDGWLPNYRTAAEAAPSLGKLEAYLAAEGRGLEEIGIEPRLLYGEPDIMRWTTLLTDWQAVGASHMTLNTMRAGLNTPQAHINALKIFADAIDLENSWS